MKLHSSPPTPPSPRSETPVTHTPGTQLYLTSLREMPALNGDHCEVVSHDAETQLVSVRRICTNEPLSVRVENLAASSPDGVGATTAALTRALGEEAVAERVLAFLDCARCHEPCTPGSTCRVPHPVDLRVAVRDSWALSSWRYPTPERRDIYRCRACHRSYGPLSWQEDEKPYCFEGEHCIVAPRGVDLRFGTASVNPLAMRRGGIPGAQMPAVVDLDREGDGDVHMMPADDSEEVIVLSSDSD